MEPILGWLSDADRGDITENAAIYLIEGNSNATSQESDSRVFSSYDEPRENPVRH